jgi:hypothetical protein
VFSMQGVFKITKKNLGRFLRSLPQRLRQPQVCLGVLQLVRLDAAHVVQVPTVLVIANLFGKRRLQCKRLCLGNRETRLMKWEQ